MLGTKKLLLKTGTIFEFLVVLLRIITWGEMYRYHYDKGFYKCARCKLLLFSHESKWNGPCVWPSFRAGVSASSLSACRVSPYNNYTVTVKELYCGGCSLFIGHQFEDGKVKGDSHPEAQWRM